MLFLLFSKISNIYHCEDETEKSIISSGSEGDLTTENDNLLQHNKPKSTNFLENNVLYEFSAN